MKRHVTAYDLVQAYCEKYNWATMAGWRVVRLTSAMLTPDYVESIIQWIQQESNSNGY